MPLVSLLTLLIPWTSLFFDLNSWPYSLEVSSDNCWSPCAYPSRMDWKPWCSLVYMRSPERDPKFKVGREEVQRFEESSERKVNLKINLQTYFSKTWADAFAVSLRNFLALIFDHLPLPRVLALNMENLEKKSRLEEIQSLVLDMQKQKYSHPSFCSQSLLLLTSSAVTLLQRRRAIATRECIEEPAILSDAEESTARDRDESTR